eukprot:366564-Chlamydomonas_euryale.AAC.14
MPPERECKAPTTTTHTHTHTHTHIHTHTDDPSLFLLLPQCLEHAHKDAEEKGLDASKLVVGQFGGAGTIPAMKLIQRFAAPLCSLQPPSLLPRGSTRRRCGQWGAATCQPSMRAGATSRWRCASRASRSARTPPWRACCWAPSGGARARRVAWHLACGKWRRRRSTCRGYARALLTRLKCRWAGGKSGAVYEPWDLLANCKATQRPVASSAASLGFMRLSAVETSVWWQSQSYSCNCMEQGCNCREQTQHEDACGCRVSNPEASEATMTGAVQPDAEDDLRVSEFLVVAQLMHACSGVKGAESRSVQPVLGQAASCMQAHLHAHQDLRSTL